jgi:hypothetical protein
MEYDFMKVYLAAQYETRGPFFPLQNKLYYELWLSPPPLAKHILVISESSSRAT